MVEGLKQQGSRITDTPEEKMENVEVQTSIHYYPNVSVCLQNLESAECRLVDNGPE